MHRYKFSKKALADLKKLPKQTQRLIVRKLEYFVSGNNPLLFAKNLTNYSLGQYRFRIGDYRVIAEIDSGQKKIQIVFVGHRKNVYDKIWLSSPL